MLSIRKHVTAKRALIVWIVIFSIVVGSGVRQNRINAQEGQQAHDAICTLKADFRLRIIDYNERITQAQIFIDEHPNGIPGISVKLLNDSLKNTKTTRKNTQSTLNSLRIVKCGEGDAK